MADTTRALVLFYAAECGLKAALLKRRGLRGLADLPEEFRTHDLRRIAKALGMAPEYLLDRYEMRPTPSGPDLILAQDLHQAWRYGKRLTEAAHQLATGALNDVLDWCEKEQR